MLLFSFLRVAFVFCNVPVEHELLRLLQGLWTIGALQDDTRPKMQGLVMLYQFFPLIEGNIVGTLQAEKPITL